MFDLGSSIRNTIDRGISVLFNTLPPDSQSPPADPQSLTLFEQAYNLLPAPLATIVSNLSNSLTFNVNFSIILWVLLIVYLFRLIYRSLAFKKIDPRGKVVVVTGAARGLGFEITKHLVELGCKVYALDLNLDALKSAYTGIDKNSVVPMTCNVTDFSQVEKIKEKINSNGDIVYGVVNNAGIPNPYLPLCMHTKSDIDKVYAVNLLGPLYFMRTFTEDLVKTSGSVVNMSSFSHYVHPPWMMAYASSKTALEAASNCVRREFGGELHPFDSLKYKGLRPPRITCIEPFFVATGIYQECNNSTRTHNLDPNNSMTHRILRSTEGDFSKKLNMIPASKVSKTVAYALFDTGAPLQIPVIGPLQWPLYIALKILPMSIQDYLITPAIRKIKHKSD